MNSPLDLQSSLIPAACLQGGAALRAELCFETFDNYRPLVVNIEMEKSR